MRDEAFLLDMVLAAREASAYLEGITWERFLEEPLLQTAVAHQVQIIGEAATNVSAEFQRAHPQIQWAKITGMRHKIVHDYRDVDLNILWSTAISDIPGLIALLEPLVPPDDP